MAQIIVSFASEEEAQNVIEQLSAMNFGEVRARVLDSSESMSYPKTESTAPIIAPDMGSIEMRPSEMPNIPEAEHENPQVETSARIPTTGSGARGVQVMIEVDDQHEEAVWKVIRREG